nr:DUF2058 domain-containing protein [Methylonatrum kenyense]
MRDQLLKAGLADEKTVKKVDREARKGRNRRKKGERTEVETRTAAARAEAEAKRQARKERDRQLNRERNAQQAATASRAQVDDLLKQHALSMRDGDRAFHFTEDGKVRRVHVTREQQMGLSAGRLAIVRHRDRYHLLPIGAAEMVRQRAPEAFLYVPQSSASEADDPFYADFPIPDDLDW